MFTITTKAFEIIFPLGQVVSIDLNLLIALWFMEAVILVLDASLGAPLAKTTIKFWGKLFDRHMSPRRMSKAISG